jgi:oligoribonuclease NrnB/cAMP/cGMP phosphodiesterase (DHH superfamily)
MTVHAIVHGDDVDGLTCGAFLKRITGCTVYLANYNNFDTALEYVHPPTDTLYLCDLNIRNELEPELMRIREFAEIFIIDHHDMSPELMERLIQNGVNINLETCDCAAVLVYEGFKEELGGEAARMAAYAAISDMFEDGPLGSKILAKMDRKFAQHEAQILTHALSMDQTIDFKRKVMDALAVFSYPHRIEGAVNLAIQCLEEMAQLKELIKKKAVIHGRLAYMEAEGKRSTGAIANLIIDALGIDVGLSYKVNTEYYNISLRGEKDIPEHLGHICKSMGEKHNGFGGGHKRASGVKIPKGNLESFLMDVIARFNTS